MTPLTVFEVIQVSGFVGAMLFGWRVLVQVTSKVDRIAEIADASRVELTRLTTIVEGRIEELEDHEERIRRLER